MRRPNNRSHKPGRAYKIAVAERAEEIAVAKLLIESRIRLAQIGVTPNMGGVHGPSRPYRWSEAGKLRRIASLRRRNYDRDAIVKFYLMPHSLRETGREFGGISIETVRQIILASGNQCHARYGRGCRPRSAT